MAIHLDKIPRSCTDPKMSRQCVARNDTTENEKLCASCQDIADHWYEIAESGSFEGRTPYSIGELLLNAESGFRLCRVIMANAGWMRDELGTKKVDLEEPANFRVYGDHFNI